MGILDELKKLTHPYDDEDEEYEELEEPRERSFDERRNKAEDRRNKVVNIHATTQLKVVLVKPDRFENASEIADQLKDKRTVVLNLESTNKDVARRLIDFLSGVAYAGEGKIKKVAANTYIITPYHVELEGDLIDELESNGLYFSAGRTSDMLTPQEVSTHSFSKASFGGYNMAMVDEFLDELTDDYTALYKENAALKAKLKVLVEKVEEYRATEDSMRATLLTAQRMADSIVKEAEQKRDQMMTQAEIDAKLKINCLKNEAIAAEERLRRGKEELEKFSAAVRAVCDKEIQLLEQLPQLPVETEPEAADAADSVQEIEDNVMAAFNAGDPVVPEAAPAEAEEKAPAEPEAESAAPAEAADPFADLSATRQINLDELKFGRNYNNND